MRIVVLDGHTLNPGDLSWDALTSLGPTQVHARTPPDHVTARAAGAAVVLTNKTVLNRTTIEALSALRYIGVLATGYNIVDCDAARARGVVVTNVPTYGTASVAQMTFALLLELTQHAGHHAGTVRAGRWSSSADFCYWDSPLIELDGLTFGVVGFGRIGQAVARIATVFGMRVAAYDTAFPVATPGVERLSLEELLRRSDVVSLHCPLTPGSAGLINAASLAVMKPTAFLINTARGPLVKEQDLADALNAGRLAGAALDVLTVEPPRLDNPLLAARNCLVTPHIAWATAAARKRLMDVAVENVRAFLTGRPQNVVT